MITREQRMGSSQMERGTKKLLGLRQVEVTHWYTFEKPIKFAHEELVRVTVGKLYLQLS